MSEKQVVLKVVVGGIVENEGKLLIIQRSADEESFPNLWEIPSGKKEPLEEVSTALIREIKEETGLDVKITETVNVFNYLIEKENETRDATQINFLVKLINGNEVKLSSEHQDFAWITEKELDKYDISDKAKEALRIAFGKLPNSKR